MQTSKGSSFFDATLRRAPHKPLLLVPVLDPVERSALAENLIYPTPALAEIFFGYWSLVMLWGKPGHWAYPFFYLRSEGFWYLVPVAGREAELCATSGTTPPAADSGFATRKSPRQPDA